MSGYSRSYVRVGNPYCLLALSVFEEAFRTIECYLTGKGKEEEIEDGKYSIKWMMKMEGSFKILAGASGRSLETYHQWCIEKINQLKKSAYNESKKLERQDKKSIQSGEGDMSMGLEESRPDSTYS